MKEHIDACADAVIPVQDGSQDIAQRIALAGNRIAALQRELDAALAELVRARRRAAADCAAAAAYGHEELARAVLPFRDALEAALAVRTDDVAALREGLVLADRQLAAALARRHA
jgi:molecular chaperone GrpE (heat shock protein)